MENRITTDIYDFLVIISTFSTQTKDLYDQYPKDLYDPYPKDLYDQYCTLILYSLNFDLHHYSMFNL